MRGLVLACLVLGLAALPVMAQAEKAVAVTSSSTPATQKYNSTDAQYLAMVADATAGKDIDWQKLRELYTETSFYDPYGGAQAVWYMLQRAGQQTVYDPSPEARQEYNNLLAQHFAHFRSHMQALDMIEKGHLPASERNFHQKALSAITAAITATGDGKSLDTAFRVIDPAEETMLLKTYFHYNLDSQEFQQKEGHFWDVLNYTDPAKGEKGSLYFNVDQILTAPARSAQK